LAAIFDRQGASSDRFLHALTMAEFPRRRWPRLLGLLTLLAAGCPANQERPYPVHGIVSLDGHPLKGGLVRFEPSSPGPSSSIYGAQGTIASDGSYRLTTSRANDGALPGWYRVVVLPGQDSSAQNPSAIPSKYYSLAGSGLEFEVKPQDNPIDIRLQSTP
jgi:hypothetical protein